MEPNTKIIDSKSKLFFFRLEEKKTNKTKTFDHKSVKIIGYFYALLILSDWALENASGNITN